MIQRHRVTRSVRLLWIIQKPEGTGSVSNKYNPSEESGFNACISSRITAVIHVTVEHQINYNCFNEPFAVSPCEDLYWDMHGLIFETSIWLLAGSTRFLSINSAFFQPESCKKLLLITNGVSSDCPSTTQKSCSGIEWISRKRLSLRHILDRENISNRINMYVSNRRCAARLCEQSFIGASTNYAKRTSTSSTIRCLE